MLGGRGYVNRIPERSRSSGFNTKIDKATRTSKSVRSLKIRPLGIA